MTIAIIAGGMGTRMQEETKTKPKALVTLGGLRIMWHMMKYFIHFGFSDFVIALRYKGDTIRDYFSATSEDGGGVQSNEQKHGNTIITTEAVSWTTRMIDNGADTQNGGRRSTMEGLGVAQ